MDYLFTAGRVCLYRRCRFTRVDGCHGGSTGACARGLRFSGSSLEDAEIYFVAAQHAHEFHVDALQEFPALADGGRTLLPLRRKLIDELDEVRVAGRDHQSACVSLLKFDRLFTYDLHVSHFDHKLKFMI